MANNEPPTASDYYNFASNATIADMAAFEWSAGNFDHRDVTIEDDGALVPLKIRIPTDHVQQFKADNPDECAEQEAA